jgi:hypothetical protein
MCKNCSCIIFYSSVQEDPAIQFDGCLAESTFPIFYEKQTSLPCHKRTATEPRGSCSHPPRQVRKYLFLYGNIILSDNCR